jgi:hypothetical protein
MIIERTAVIGSVAVGTTLANSQPFSFGDCTEGCLVLPSTEAGTVTLTYYVSDSESGTFVPVLAHDGSSNLTGTAAGGKAKQLPPALSPAPWVKVVASAISSGTSVTYTFLGKA